MTSVTKPTEHKTGMGAIPYNGGTAFRVWAPNAEQVWVSGDFNQWSKKHALTSEENGYWYAEVPEAKTGDEYQYILLNGKQELERIDPYAMQVPIR